MPKISLVARIFNFTLCRSDHVISESDDAHKKIANLAKVHQNLATVIYTRKKKRGKY